jgi:hypothetical protein
VLAGSQSLLCRELFSFLAMSIGVMVGVVHAQNTLYDGFSNKELDPTKWSSQQSGTGGIELIRNIFFNRLVMSHRVIGATSADLGQRSSRNQLRFVSGGSLTAIKFDMMVQDFQVLGCEVPGASISRSLAGFFGAFFNDGSSTGTGDQTGDVNVFLFLYRTSDSTDPEHLLRTEAGMIRCANSNCTTPENIEILDLGTVAKGESVTLRLNWERDKRQMNFQKNDDEVRSITYTLPVVNLRSYRVFDIRGDAANCPSGPRPFARVTAFLDNVFVNP